jgi:DNA (cytosine-5)-methyltransferase 1
MSRPRLLDLFCGAGGAAMGYHRAGFDVEGVDLLPHPDYPFTMHVADAMTFPLAGYAAIHASPPCPLYSSITPEATRSQHPDLVGPVRDRLLASGVVYVIENVVGAPLIGPVLYCGKAMGLPHIRRHRLFESNQFLMSPGCACDYGPAFGIYGDHGDKIPRDRKDGYKRWGKARDVEHAQQIMGIDWMTDWDDLADAVPPVYTQHIGEQLRAALVAAA